jgi:hypothetical protein
MNRIALLALPVLALGSVSLAQAAVPVTPAAPKPAATSHRYSDTTQQARRETAALNLIESKGYGDYTDFRADGRNFSAQVMSHGKRMTVIADPDTGKVTRQG